MTADEADATIHRLLRAADGAISDDVVRRIIQLVISLPPHRLAEVAARMKAAIDAVQNDPTSYEVGLDGKGLPAAVRKVGE